MPSRRRRSSVELEVQTNVPFAISSIDELQARHLDSNAELTDAGGLEQQLEAADGGVAAWTILFAAFMFGAILFGMGCPDVHATRLGDGVIRLLNGYQASRFHLVYSRITIQSSQNSRTIHTYLSLGRWRLACPILVAQ